ncbi:MAG: hypothetical protein IJP61_08055 [Treponema sp.]|nr:hypothetical protein [Treponema sp.]
MDSELIRAWSGCPQIDSKTPNGLPIWAESRAASPSQQSDTKSAQREEKQKGLERLQGAKERSD